MKNKKAIIISFIVIAVICLIPTIGILATSVSDFMLDGDVLMKYTGTDTEITTPKGVKVISVEAFVDSKQLESVVVSEGVTKIDYAAFSELDNLQEVKLPKSLEIIGNDAFKGCSDLEKINIGSKVNKIYDGVFAGCESLKDISIDKENKYYCLEDFVIYNKDKTRLISILPSRVKSDYAMPSTVTSMDQFSAYDLEALKKVYLSSNLVEISPYAFANCENLSNVSIPYSVTTIGMYAFANCSSLIEMDIPVSAKNIHSSAFKGSGLEIIENENKDVDDLLDSLEDNDDIIDNDKENDDIEVDSNLDKNSVLGKTVIVDNEAVFLNDFKNGVIVGKDK